MQTQFTRIQLENARMREADAILRKCVHCGFCNAACPTYRLLGDELDGPRGRIYLIKEMLEGGHAPPDPTVQHLDRCLSCLSCATACPSGVDYMHLADLARAHIEESHQRLPADRLMRRMVLTLMTRPRLLAALLPLLRAAAAITEPLLRGRLRAMSRLVQESSATATALAAFYPATVETRGVVALLPGCVQQALDNEINHATVRLLNRLGWSVHVAQAMACCGAIEQHLGQRSPALRRVQANVDCWRRLAHATGVQALIVNASGCGTVLKDYGHMLRDDAARAREAQEMGAMVMDISEFLDRSDLSCIQLRPGLRPAVAWQNPCSMLHGQGIAEEPLRLLRRFGFDVSEPAEPRLCCGSAGTYNLLQPELAAELGQRKAAALLDLRPGLIASGNLGCMLQLRQYLDLPVVHLVQLLDWASGGPVPHGARFPV